MRDAADVAAELAATASVELTPAEVDGHLDHVAGKLPAGTRVFLTALPNRPHGEQLAAAEKVHSAGFAPVPHIAARAYADLGELERHLGRLVADAGVREALVIAGGNARPVGSIDSSLDVLRAGVVQDAGIARIGVAGYPEGIRDIPAAAVSDALAEKNRLAAEQGLDMRIVTQFAFDPDVYLGWERAARAAGNRLPVTVGLPGVVSARKLLRFAVRCGIGASANVLRKHGRGLSALTGFRAWRPDEVLAGISAGVARDPDCLIDALHLFAFGNVVATADWLDALRRG